MYGLWIPHGVFEPVQVPMRRYPTLERAVRAGQRVASAHGKSVEIWWLNDAGIRKMMTRVLAPREA